MSDEETNELDNCEPEADESDRCCDLTDLERRHYEDIKELERKAIDAEGVYLDAKSDAKAAKEVWERAVDRLRSLIRQGPNPQRELPFNDENEAAADACKETPIADVLDLTSKQTETLTAVGVNNVGQFEDLRSGQKPDFPDGLLSLPRVGQTTVDKWEDQIVDWLAANAREQEPAEDEAVAAASDY